jgi:hypothetical protein
MAPRFTRSRRLRPVRGSGGAASVSSLTGSPAFRAVYTPSVHCEGDIERYSARHTVNHPRWPNFSVVEVVVLLSVTAELAR